MKVLLWCVCCDWFSLIGAAPGRGSCPIQRPLTFDLIYTDYHGLTHLQGAMGLAFLHYQYEQYFWMYCILMLLMHCFFRWNWWSLQNLVYVKNILWHLRCRFRILDSFGTEPAFNLGSYARSHGYKTLWGSWGLQPQQYMTMFRESLFMHVLLSNSCNHANMCVSM